MSAHYLVVKVETGQGDLSPSKGYKHLATDIYDFLEDDFEECGMGWEVKAVERFVLFISRKQILPTQHLVMLINLLGMM